MPVISFSKYSGCGNDFIIIDNRSFHFPVDDLALIRHLCKPRIGIGADGIILLENSHSADFRMRIFNADGTEAEMCGNGLRCLGKFLEEINIPGTEFSIEVMGKQHRITITPDAVTVTLPPAENIEWSKQLSMGGETFDLDYLNTGVPHAILFTDNLESADLVHAAPQIRHHHAFSPQGTNVNYASVDSQGVVHVRTYERGVEKETLSCGTGSAAAALAASKRFGIACPVKVQTRTGEILEISWPLKGSDVQEITIKGPVKKIYTGLVAI